MKLLCGIILLVGVFTLNDATSVTTMKRIATDQLLMQQLMRSRANSPSYAEPCFGTYLPIYNAILEEFSTSYQQCTLIAETEQKQLDAEALGNKTVISATAQDVCNTMIDCSALDDSLEFLDCYSQVGDGNIKSLYVVTNNATDVAANLREQYRLIQNNMGRCHNASERQYVQNTADTTDALNYCLDNGPPEVITTTTVITTTVEEDTTTPIEEDTTTPAEEDTTSPADEDTTTPAEEDTTTPADEDTTTPAEEDTTTSAEEDTTTPAEEDTTTEPESAFEEEDLSRIVRIRPQLISSRKYKRLNRGN